MSAAPSEVACPDCGKVGSRQLHGGAGLVFKGSGFYLTDYGKNAHRGESSSDSGSKNKSETVKSETKSESAPAKAESAAPKAEAPKQKAESKPAKKPKAE